MKIDPRAVCRLVVGLCAAYARPGVAHACGHDVVAAASTGAALALAEVADRLGITVALFGTPAEEGGGRKVLMFERGYSAVWRWR